MTNGVLSTGVLSGTYAIDSNCTGTFTLYVNSQLGGQATFQVINDGRNAVMVFSNPTSLVTGTLYRQSVDSSTSCNDASISGGYGYLLTGVVGRSVYIDNGNVSADGNGNVTVRSTVTLGGAVSSAIASGTYSVNSTCTGTAWLTDQQGNVANYLTAVANDGATILFLRADAGTNISGLVAPQLIAPQQSVVNGASFAPRRLAPGSLISVFGKGLSQQTASATSLPLPTTLASTQVLINGRPAPLDYVSPTQINAQVPLETPVSTPITISVVNAGKHIKSRRITLLPAAPGIFTYGQNQAVVQNQDLSVNSPTHPAHPGDVVVVYLTGGGSVNASGPWVTGRASPSGISPVTSSYSITVGDKQAEVFYVGLTPDFVGLYQANVKVPSIAPGNYPLSITINGVRSNGPAISVAQ
jgi:uncharacterized protein (TIGR03437 family)